MSADTRFGQAWRQERDRLRAPEALFDPATTGHLAGLGLRDGWRCLEVGAGSIARWLAMRVGPSGHVLATDLDPRFLDDHGHDNLEVRRHDITADPLPEGLFDLVHSRAVLQHLPDRERALARMVAAVRPGGWVVAEDLEYAEPMLAALLRHVDPPERAGPWGRLARGIRALLGAAGHDADLVARLPRTLRAAGLGHVEAEVHAPLLHGGVERDFAGLTVRQLRPRLVDEGLLTDQEADTVLELSAQPWVRHLPFVAVTAWGRRPAAGVRADGGGRLPGAGVRGTRRGPRAVRAGLHQRPGRAQQDRVCGRPTSARHPPTSARHSTGRAERTDEA